MVDTTGRSVEDQEVEIAALTFECRLAVEAVVLRTKRLERIPASPTLKAELERIITILEQMASAFEDLHGAITRFLCPQNALAAADLPSASHQDIEEVGAAILQASRPAGGYIEEADLAVRLGKDRAIVRNAAVWLESRGLIKRIGECGLSVHAFTRDDLRDVYEIREVFEPIACRLAASAISDEELNWLSHSIEQQGKSFGDSAAASGHPYNDFPIQVILASKNPSLIELLCDNLHYKLRFYRDFFSMTPDWLENASQERRRIVKALQARNAELAAAEMRRHLVSTRKGTVWAEDIVQSCRIESLDAYRRARRAVPQ
jgi:DNA-binding GntR family transcriptional regulator